MTDLKENRCKKSPDRPNINMDCDKNRSENHNTHFSYVQKDNVAQITVLTKVTQGPQKERGRG
jgi:hypothetical protein